MSHILQHTTPYTVTEARLKGIINDMAWLNSFTYTVDKSKCSAQIRGNFLTKQKSRLKRIKVNSHTLASHLLSILKINLGLTVCKQNDPE